MRRVWDTSIKNIGTAENSGVLDRYCVYDGRDAHIDIYDETGNERVTKTIEASDATGSGVPPQIESIFDEDADGWLVSQNGGSTTPEY